MQQNDLAGLIIGGIAVTGGLAIGAIAIVVSIPWGMKEKLAKLEAKTRERMVLIEKGYDPMEVFKEKKKVGNDPLFWGFLVAGLGLGLFLGYVLALTKGWDVKILTNALACFLGGLGMIIYHFYTRKRDEQRPV
jgi:hypothetical protein